MGLCFCVCGKHRRKTLRPLHNGGSALLLWLRRTSLAFLAKVVLHNSSYREALKIEVLELQYWLFIFCFEDC